MRFRLFALFFVFTLSLGAAASNHPGVSQVGQLLATDVTTYDLFGASVAVSSSTIAVGSPDSNNLFGSIYVYEKPAAGWGTMTQTAKLAPLTGCGAGYPIAISSDGSTIVAGVGGCNLGGYPGYGWLEVFVRPASGWHDTQQPTAILSLSNTGQYNFMGLYLAISPDGKTIAGTGYFYYPQKSFVFLFDRPASGWTSMNPTATVATGNVNVSPVAISGNTVSLIDMIHGSLLVYERKSSGIQKVATLTSSDGAMLYYAVAMNSDTIVAAVLANPGAVEVFAKPSTGWTNATETARLTAPNLPGGVAFGWSLGLIEKVITVGGFSTSAAYVYVEPAGGWQTTSQPTTTLLSSDPYQKRFGAAVAISGSTIVVGDPAEGANDNNNGAAYVFQTQ